MKRPKTPIPTKADVADSWNKVHNAFVDIQIKELREVVRMVEGRIVELEATKKP